MALSVIRGTTTFLQQLGQSRHAERVLSKLKNENPRNLFCSARVHRAVTDKKPQHRSAGRGC
jgi:hypothetical protein